MKKISALLAIVMLLSVCVFAFSSCGSGINVNSVKNDPVKFINEATNKANAEFFKDDTGIMDIIAQVLGNKGSLKLSADLTDIILAPAKFDMTIYNDTKAKKDAIDLNVNVNGENFGGQFFGSTEGLIFRSEALLGTNQAYLYNPKTLIDGIENSEFAELFPAEAIETLKANAAEYLEMLKYMTETTAEKANENAKKLYEALEYTTNDAGECVALVMKINNQTLRKLLDKALEAYEFSESNNYKDQFNTFFNEIDKVATIDAEMTYMIRKDNGALNKYEIRGKVAAGGTSINIEMGYSVNAEKMETYIKIGASVENHTGSGFGPINTTPATQTSVDINLETVKEKSGAAIKYTTTAKMTVGNATMTVGKLTFDHNNSDGKYALKLLVAKELVGSLQNLEMSVSGIAKKDGGKVTLTLAEIDASAFLGNKLDLDITLVFDKDASVPEFPKDAKDMVNLTAEEIQNIVNNIAALFPQQGYPKNVA